MFDYFIGQVAQVLADAIIFEVNQIGYHICVPKSFRFHEGEEHKLFVEDFLREDGMFLVGFSSIEEREVFHGLCTVNGIGPKSAIRILGECEYLDLKKAIAANNVFYLRSVKGIGSKASAQILLDLRGFFDLSQNINVNQYDEVMSALRSLGYRVRDINPVLSSINIPDASNETILKEALRRLAKHVQRYRKQS